MIGQRPSIQVFKASGPPTSPAPSVWLIASAYNATTGTWTDAGSLGFSPGQASAPLRPTLLADSGFKGKPAVQYSATQNLTGDLMPLTDNRTKGTLMCAFGSDTGGPPGGSIYTTAQNQLGILADGRFALNTAAGEYGTMAPGAKDGMLSVTGGQVVTGIYDGTLSGNANRLRLFRNLLEETLTYNGTISAITYAGGQAVFLSREADGAGWAHRCLEILFWRARALTTGERQAWEAYLAAKYFTKSGYQLSVVGDSNGAGAPDNVANPWPKRVADAKGWPYYNGSTVGYKLAQQGGGPSNLRDDWLTAQPFLVALGTNDLAVDHASLATLQGYWNTLKTRSLACRFPLFALTIPAADPAITGADETTRVAYNAWLATLPNMTVIDIATALGSATGPNFDGGLHFNNAGHTVVANTVLAAFQAAGY